MKISKWMMFLLVFVVLGHKSVGHCHFNNENHHNDCCLIIQYFEVSEFWGSHCQGEHIIHHLEDFTNESVLKIKQLLIDCYLPNTTLQHFSLSFYKSEFQDLFKANFDILLLNNCNLRAPPYLV